MTRYALEILDEAEGEYRHEFEYSARNWGTEHAEKFFKAIDALILNLRESPFRHPKKDRLGGGMHLIVTKGLLIPYKIDEARKSMTVIGFLGRNRYHQLAKEVRQRVRPKA